MCQPPGGFRAEESLSLLKELITMRVSAAVWGNYCGLISFSAFFWLETRGVVEVAVLGHHNKRLEMPGQVL